MSKSRLFGKIENITTWHLLPPLSRIATMMVLMNLSWLTISFMSRKRLWITSISIFFAKTLHNSWGITRKHWSDEEAQSKWEKRSYETYGICYELDLRDVQSSISSLQGFVIETNAPLETDRGDMSLASFRNRNRFSAWIWQAFCDCNAKIRMFEIAWPGSTNDIIAYRQSILYKLYKDGRIHELVHLRPKNKDWYLSIPLIHCNSLRD